jgi:ribonuclease E
VTCPRCNGVGVIRDTESSALHCLRILQEEAMKEGTAAVHAQVPVEVATFLLNEKRADIAKLEARLRVSVVLIPNKFLETPHYHIERLRHDDPRLDEPKASFERAAELAPSTDTPYTTGKAEAERERPKQEAVVKGIVPETPAPVSAVPAAVPVAAPAAQPAPAPSGLWGRIVSFFTGGPQPAPVAAPAAIVRPASDKRTDEGRGESRRGRQERDGRRNGRRDEKRGERRDEKPEERRDGKRDEPRREAKQDNRGRRNEGRTQEPRAAGEPSEGRRPRGERRPEKERDQAAPPAAEVETGVAVAAAVDQAAAPAAVASLVAADAGTEAAQGEPRRRRRRRRGRGARSDEGTGTDTALEGGATEDQDALEGESAEVEASEPAITETAAAPEAPAPVVVAPAPAAMAPAPVAVQPTPVAVADFTTLRTPDMATVPAIVTLPAALPAPLRIEQLQPVLELAGLTLVQTEPSKHAETTARLASEPRPKRVPRERPMLPPIEETPLVQVETRPAQRPGA